MDELLEVYLPIHTFFRKKIDGWGCSGLGARYETP